MTDAWLPPEVATPIRRTVLDVIRRYHRHEVYVDGAVPGEPVLFVGNHGFGSVTDPNVLATAAALDRAGRQREQTYLVHDLAWILKVGGLVAAFGGAPARESSALQAWDAGRDVVVFPGGDLDAGKSWRDRNRISFFGRSGFARLAITRGVPVVPVVTAGAGDGAFVLSDGQRLATALRLPRLARTKALPISLSVPWGLSVGLSGVLPYLPLPSKLVTAVMPAMLPAADEGSADFALRVQARMQERLDELVENRVPLIG